MEISSINQIQELRVKLRERISKMDKKSYSGQLYGQENEYTYKAMLGGIESLLIDVNSLVKAPKIFLKLSTYQERNNIINIMSYIDSNLNSPNQLYQYIEQFKSLLRQYNVRFTNERFTELDKEISEIVARKISLHDNIESVDTSRKMLLDTIEVLENKKDDLEKKIKDSKDALESLNKDIDNVENKAQVLAAVAEEVEFKKQIVQESLNEVKSNEKLIDSFSQRVQQREAQLDLVTAATSEYSKKLIDFSEERMNLLEEAKSLIESAKDALNYKTAEGISASFQTQYEDLNNTPLWPWLAGAAFCLMGTVGLGIWVLSVKAPDMIIVVSRLLLLPICILGAVFCANQYVRYKDMIQDYAYKMVLSKSLVGFSDQIKKHSHSNEEYIHYIKTVLGEIHNDPLRRSVKHTDGKHHLESLLNVDAQKLDKVLEIINGVVKSVK